MPDHWYLTREGETLGPLSPVQLSELLSTGRLAPGELLWLEGMDVQISVQRYQEMLRTGPVPDWLEGLRQAASPMARARPPAPEERWYSVQKPRRRGPFSRAQLSRMAAAGELCPEDLLMREAAEGCTTVQARTVLAFPVPGPPVASPADWLADVAQSERVAAVPINPTSTGVPDWLADVGQNEGPASVSPSAPPAPPSSPTAGILAVSAAKPAAHAPIPMDWLEDIRQIEEALNRRTPCPSPALSPVVVPPAPSAPAAPPGTAPVVPTPFVEPPVARACAPAVSIPSLAAPPAVPVAPAPASRPEACGYDPDTGQILDPAAYARWRKDEEKHRQEEANRQPAVSVFEAFLAGRMALHGWVDADENKPVVVAGDVEAARRCPQLQATMEKYTGYGPIMMEKLSKHLAMLVENRQKFYRAFA
jgi:hypothetical protein